MNGIPAIDNHGRASINYIFTVMSQSQTAQPRSICYAQPFLIENHVDASANTSR